MDAKDGFVKLLADPKSGEILGGACVGPVGGELLHEIVAAMAKRMTVHELAAMPHYHPTLAEIWTYPAEELAEQIVLTHAALNRPAFNQAGCPVKAGTLPGRGYYAAETGVLAGASKRIPDQLRHLVWLIRLGQKGDGIPTEVPAHKGGSVSAGVNVFKPGFRRFNSAASSSPVMPPGMIMSVRSKSIRPWCSSQTCNASTPEQRGQM